MTEKAKKLAFYISFKQSEEQLYNDMKKVDDYSNVLKGLMRDYLYGKKEDNSNSNKTDDKSMIVTVDDICKILSSVNVVQTVAAPTVDTTNTTNDTTPGTEDDIPDDVMGQL